jgi:hypothetical protein
MLTDDTLDLAPSAQLIEALMRRVDVFICAMPVPGTANLAWARKGEAMALVGLCESFKHLLLTERATAPPPYHPQG